MINISKSSLGYALKKSLMKYQQLRYAHDTALMAEIEELKSLSMRMKEESETAGLKLNIKKILVKFPM